MIVSDKKNQVKTSNILTTIEGKQRNRQIRPRRISVIAMNQKKNHQETKLLIILATIFFVCVLPYHVLYFHQLLKRAKSLPSHQSVLIFISLMILQMLNSVLNPFIYAMFYAPFQKSSVKIFTFPCHCVLQLGRKWKGNNSQHHHMNGSQRLYLNQSFVDGSGHSSRKASRVSFGGRRYSTPTNDERKYSRVSNYEY